MNAQWQNPRKISERVVIQADLELVSPTHIGCGDTDSLLDMPLARDPLSGKALLSGASVAGALRAYLVKCGKEDWAGKLFGRVDEKKVGFESLLIVDDAIGEIPQTEIRDGVTINAQTRTAEDKKKYDFELMPAGMAFKPCFELIVARGDEHLLDALALALKGLESGEISLGKRKRRGFGECDVKNWKIWRFPWDSGGMLKWLDFDPQKTNAHNTGANIDQLLLKKTLSAPAEDKRCLLSATFLIHSSLLMRSEVDKAAESGYQPDSRHLRRKNKGKEELIVSGTGLAGVLRARARRICNTFEKDGNSITDDLFGNCPEGNQEEKAPRATASRVWVKEAVIKKPAEAPQEMVQTRVTIDRFTGGASESRLFAEQPVFGDRDTSVEFHIEIENAKRPEVGLVLLLLKDLWLGDLPLGGESSVGRGLLAGWQANLRFEQQSWTFKESGHAIHVSGDKTALLQKYVDAFIQEG